MNIIEPDKMKEQFNIAVIVSRFNEEITTKLIDGAIARLQELEFADDQITVVKVAGAIEIPLLAQRLARSDRYQAIVCLGAVIRGETSHFDYVCQQVSFGCQRVALDHEIPVIFGILTTDTIEQAYDRVGGNHGHKGRDAIDTAVEMVSILRNVSKITQ